MSKDSLMSETPIYFEPAQAGKSLREVGVDFLDVENQKITSRWFRSGRDVDLFIWLDAQKKVIKQQMSFCGQIVEWNILDGLKTGVVIEEESLDESDEGQKNSSEVIRFDQKPQPQAIRMALEVIQNMEPINQSEKDDLLLNFGANELPRLLGGMGSGSLWQRFKYWLSRRS